MNTDNTQDGAEPSPASVGSQPVAWAVFEADGNCIGTYSTQAHARIVIEELAYDGMVYEPLYRQPGPTLAENERLKEAIRRIADQDATLSVCDGNVAVTMEGTITDAEREAIERAAAIADEFHDTRLAATLRALLERLK
jgi:hypothetical protein